MRPSNSILSTLVCLAAALGACQPAADEPVADTGPAAAVAAKPTAPISISYEVVGAAIVGQPVQVNIVVQSSAGPVDVAYTVNDSSAVSLQVDQVDRVQILDASSGSVQQLTVVPLREGRVYVNVSAEVQTEGGPKIRSMAIPIRVGKAPQESTPNGEIVEGPDGEAVNSLPATET